MLYDIKDNELWTEEEKHKLCGNSSGYLVTASWEYQVICQTTCELTPSCIGIASSKELGYDDVCIICYDDNLFPAPHGFGFYRRPAGTYGPGTLFD